MAKIKKDTKAKKATKTVMISQALAELKLLDKKINKKSSVAMVGYSVAGKVKDAFDADAAKTDLQSVEDMISNRDSIRNAINSSNMKTKVTISGNNITVSEAITTKDTITYKKTLLLEMKNRFSHVTRYIDSANEEMQDRLDRQLGSIEDKKLITQISEDFTKRNEAVMVDPVGIAKYMEDLETEILDFESEVDYVLSTSNATTTVEV